MRKKSPLSEAMKNTNYKYIMYLQKLTSLALSCYKWEGLPPSVNERYLELGLFEYGHMLYFNDEVLGNICLQANLGGNFDIYNVPVRRHAYANNGYRNILNQDNSVVIYNNYLRTPTFPVVKMYVDQLVNLSDAINVNINSQKTPFIILTDLNTKLSMSNIWDRIVGNEPVIFGDKNALNLQNIEVLRTDSPYVADKLYLMFQNIYNEYLSYLGIENMGLSIVKSERLTAAEGIANDGNVEAYRNNYLLARQQAAEEINRMFGTNISVAFNSNIHSMVNGFLNEDISMIDLEEGDDA